MKNIFITWHNPKEGVASLKYILEVFATEKKMPATINLNKTIERGSVFSPIENIGFVFDEIIYITTHDGVFNKFAKKPLGSLDWMYFHKEFQKKGLKESFELLIKKKTIHHTDTESHPKVQERYQRKLQDSKGSAWRSIPYYDVDVQLQWMDEETNFKSTCNNTLKIVKLNVDDLSNEMAICAELNKWASNYDFKPESTNYFIDISTGTTEMQVVWHILAQAGRLPSNTRFIKTKFVEEIVKIHYSILETPFNLLSSMTTGLTIYKKPVSVSRALVNKKMDTFLKTGFSILLIGERGTGKSRIACEAKKSIDSKLQFVEANCASFDEDSKAEAELFGYEGGSFTGSLKNGKKGLLEEAHEGILFLDEVHLLSKLVQGKLMKALQTDEFNYMSIRKMGSNKEIRVKCRIIFATNKSIDELRKLLLPDFYDRIVQHVILIPPLRETKDDRLTDWKGVWTALKFQGTPVVPLEPEFISWLSSLPLFGNFRDLQKIAMYFNVFNQFDEETKKMINETTAIQYAKHEFEKYHSSPIHNSLEKFNFNTYQTTKEMIADYQFQLQDWAVKTFGSGKNAERHFQDLGDTFTVKSLNDWKRKKSIKK